MESLVQDDDDPRVAGFRDLKGRARDPGRDPGRVVIEGEIAVARALSSAFAVEAVLATPDRLARLGPLVRPGTLALPVDARRLDAIAGVDLHRGCLALVRRPAPARVVPPAGPTTTTLVAEGVADPVNVGALVRNARAFGVDLVVLDPHGGDPWSPRAVRAAMGHVFDQPLVVAEDLAAAVLALAAPREGAGENARPQVLAAVADPTATPLGRVRRRAHVVLLVGNEGRGLGAGLLARAEVRVTIPLARGVDSLNVAAATAILLHALGPEAPRC